MSITRDTRRKFVNTKEIMHSDNIFSQKIDLEYNFFAVLIISGHSEGSINSVRIF